MLQRRSQWRFYIGSIRTTSCPRQEQGLRQTLNEALIDLSVERIARVVQRIAEHDARLGATLARYANALDFMPVLQALEPETDTEFSVTRDILLDQERVARSVGVVGNGG